MKNISQNSLEELLDMMSKIQHIVDSYSHVNEFVPKNIINALLNYQEKLYTEDERRAELTED